jgi:hypothetical protein
MKSNLWHPNIVVRLAGDISYFSGNDKFLFVKHNNGLFRISQGDTREVPQKLFDFLREPKKLMDVVNYLSEFRRYDILSIIKKLQQLGILEFEADDRPSDHDNSLARYSITLKKGDYLLRTSFTKRRYKKALSKKRILLIGGGVLANKLI